MVRLVLHDATYIPIPPVRKIDTTGGNEVSTSVHRVHRAFLCNHGLPL